MRSTITLEPDVRKLIEQSMQVNKRSFKDTVNEAIRRGLVPHARARTRIEVPSLVLGLLPGIDPQRLNATLDEALDEDAAQALVGCS